ncbi:MYXO-CTERM sorting domain-containing protein [Myxococcota bacterium]|nr:MYXO-CTERM sorting domain-containing protein [Myxococcota bacterium]
MMALLGALPVAWAATGGPDAGGVSWLDSDEAEGPPTTLLDITAEGALLTLGDEAQTPLSLPFTVSWYGSEETVLYVGDNATAFFSGSQDAADVTCAPGGAWSGVAAWWLDHDGAEARTATLGQYPRRLFVIDWTNAQPKGATGDGQVQVWFQEARDEAVIVLGDLDVGDAAFDGGAGAVIGVQGSASAGVAWSCAGGLSDGLSAWFGPESSRPGAAAVKLGDQSRAWYGGASYGYLGQTLAGGDLNDDGLSELIMGAPEDDQVVITYGGLAPGSGDASAAEAIFTGASGGELGAAMLVVDLDGDGLDDVVLGEPRSDTAGKDAGAVYLLRHDTFGGTNAVKTFADATLTGDPSSDAQAGDGLASADVDGDGYSDLFIGAPGDDTDGLNAGAVVLWSGGVSWSSGSLVGLPTLGGASAGDKLGLALSTGDVDGDGLGDLFAGSATSDIAATDAGAAWLVLGGGRAGRADIDAEAIAEITGVTALDYLGASVLLLDLDGDGLDDLALGAPRQDSGASNAGAVVLFYDGSSVVGAVSAASADGRVLGDGSAALLGTALASGDLDGDGVEDLLIGGPGAYSSAGAAWVIRHAPVGDLLASDADHSLRGGYSGGAAGTGLTLLADQDGDGFGEVAVGAWFGSVATYTLNGVVSIWPYRPSFLDVDGDGLVGAAADGPDCDDEDAGAFPGNDEGLALDAAGYAYDDDCDGWVDGVYLTRTRGEHLAYELVEVLGDPAAELFNFESTSSGASVETLYAGNGLSLAGSGGVIAASAVYGSDAVGRFAAQVNPTSAGNQLTLSFDRDVDALSFQLLDGVETLALQAWDADGLDLLVSGGAAPLSHPGEDVPGGRFVGGIFASPARLVTLSAPTADGWGLDNLRVYWSEESDRDADGWRGLDGDCDDSDAAIYPGATEDLANGKDDDCDGIIDGGGATLWTDAAAWEAETVAELTAINFEELSLGDTVLDQYNALGLDADAELRVANDLDGAAPRDSQGAQALRASVELRFEEVQPAVLFYLLDGQGSFEVDGLLDGVTLYGVTIAAKGDDVAGGEVVGLTFDLGVDTLIITGPAADVWGLDDFTFNALGLDDADGDGFTEAEGDCDDHDDEVSPDAVEVFYDGVDADCSGDSDRDADGDGFDLELDCDDGDDEINPDAEETFYDGIDADCAGSDFDADGDGHDDLAWGGDDCDDADGAVSPSAAETFYDGVDDNCEPLDDDDSDGDGFSAAGFPGGLLGSGDCDDAADAVNPDAEETFYDGVDADCDGGSDYDADGDGFESFAHGGEDCLDDDPTAYPGAKDTLYDGIDSDCAGDSDFDGDGDGYDSTLGGGLDCDDSDAAISPDAVESDLNDGIDEDCDGTDEWDLDGDGHRPPERGGEDCDDADATVSPSAPETCYDGQDQDCDGLADDNDCDGDGYDALAAGGDDCDDLNGGVNPGARDYAYDGVDQDCDGRDDYDDDGDGHAVSWYGGGDCDDADATVNPDAVEVFYDGVDQDCDGASDYDADGDGQDSAAYGGDDCDDDDATIYLGALDLPYDGVDQSCDGKDAEDVDGDGHGDVAHGGDDCDDGDATVSPGAAEVFYDGVDQDCDGASDYDADGDGHDSDAWGGDDCDDDDDRSYPGASERWYDGVDQGCDGGDDYDQDGDGHAAEAWGGEDCDDTKASVSPDVALDDCRRGDEDCDGEEDEDCVEAPGDSGGDDTSADDTSGGGDSGGADDSRMTDSGGEDSDPGDDTAILSDSDGGVNDDTASGLDPKDDGRGGGCGCASASRGELGGGAFGLVLLAALTARRRRS